MNQSSPTPSVNYQTAAERAQLARPRVTEAEIEAGASAECVGCGSTKSLAQIRADAPQAVSCCPERAMRAPGSALDLAALIREVDELPNPQRSLMSQNERVLIEFCHRLALPLRAMNSRRVQVDYTNHEGKRGLRTITPLGAYFGTCLPWHPEPQWLIPCIDHDRDAVRVYAQAGVHAWDDVLVEQEDTVNEAAARIFARLCEFDDRTSPAEYPDMVLVTAEELSGLMTEELAPARPVPAPRDLAHLSAVCGRAIADAGITNCNATEAEPVVRAILAELYF
jgi:hypothetical protein